MKVGIIQSNYIPWKGYFDFIDDVDLFVIYDDVQFTNRDWRNRNRIKTRNGLSWLTVPIKNQHIIQTIQETEIDYSEPWQESHLNKIRHNYLKTPYFDTCINQFSEIISLKYNSISELNTYLIKWIMKKLDINTPIKMSSELDPVGSKTERLIDILTKLNASSYLSGPSAENYLNYKMFEDAGIDLYYKSYVYKEYPQQFQPFEGAVTVLDLMFNIGCNVREYLKSISSNTKIIDSKKLEFPR